MDAREFLKTKMFWSQDDIPVNTVMPKDIIDWLEDYAAIKSNAILSHISNRAFIAEDAETDEQIIVNVYTIEEAISILESNGYPSTTEIRYMPLKSLY